MVFKQQNKNIIFQGSGIHKVLTNFCHHFSVVDEMVIELSMNDTFSEQEVTVVTNKTASPVSNGTSSGKRTC